MTPATWAHRSTRPLVRWLLGTPIRANHLTALRLITGLAAAWCYARGEAGWGGLAFLLSAFLDRADGELARLGGHTSDLGHRLDFASDMAVTVLVFVAIGAGLKTHSWIGPFAIALGLTAGLSILMIFLLVLRLQTLGIAAFEGNGRFDPDDALLLIAPIGWLGALVWLLLAAGIGAPLVLCAAIWRWRHALLAS